MMQWSGCAGEKLPKGAGGVRRGDDSQPAAHPAMPRVLLHYDQVRSSIGPTNCMSPERRLLRMTIRANMNPRLPLRS